MKIQEFIDKYNAFSNEVLKDTYIKEVVKDIYIPYTEKSVICENIVKATTTKQVSDGKNEKTIFYSDSANRYILFQMRLIQAYTDLEFSQGIDAIKEFELLDQYGLNDVIVQTIPEREYTNFKVILDMKIDDASINENNFIRYIDTKIDAINLVFDTLFDGFSNILNDPKTLETIKESVENGENVIPFKEILEQSEKENNKE